MSVQNVVLGQLIQRRGYGYELADRLREWAEAFDLSGTAVYVALRQLERKGLAVEVGRDEAAAPLGRQPAMRVIFEVTAAGRTHFERWLATNPKKTPLREELHMQLLVAEDKDFPTLIEALQQIDDDCRDRLARVLAMSFDSAGSPHVRINEVTAPLVIDALASHLQSTMEWAERSRTALENYLQFGGASRKLP